MSVENMTEAVKMTVYLENVGAIAEYLLKKFYADQADLFDPYYDPTTTEIRKQECMDKAVRLYYFFSSVEEVKKMMEFLNTVNPGMARELADSL